ncbi:hypothetical protein RFI_10882 [Reticulomyxa filosa]|uniref:Uncharacterized protein n=1 Tax=Reticulomyxa filosa TaxID=46433 RepID=X6NKI6_RETFI|nr:hypothetical protein RFI_10882 [Reticulomyxa filosa]|eukprot:ETO26254.1 hypothetical protein RFI_10882 [Reticulomyxa filosa]
MQTARHVCTYLIVSGILEFEGMYELTGHDLHNRGEWVKVGDSNKNITYISSSWVLWDVSKNNGLNNSYTVASTDWRPPSYAVWYRQYIDADEMWHQDLNASVTTVCYATIPPTKMPTALPTMAPTRSQCVAIFVSNNTNTLSSVPLQVSGWYNRQSYLINRKWWWLKVDSTVAIKFFDGQWYLQEYNTTLDSETMPNRLLTNGSAFDDRPPSLATWIYAKFPLSSVQISATCHKTSNPTPSPTQSPTQTPTSSFVFFFFFNFFIFAPLLFFIFLFFYFFFIANFRNFFFNLSQDIKVYWDVPTAKDDQSFSIGIWEWVWSGVSTIEERQTKVAITSGDKLTPGRRYKLVYMATDIYQASSNCTVNIYVIDNSAYNSNSYDSCFQHGFAINVDVNQDTYSTLDNEKSTYSVDNGEISGQVYWTTPDTQSINCYVKALMVGKVAAKSSVVATTKYLGVSAATTVWQVFILILIIIVLCLFGEAVRRRVIEYRNKKKPDAEKSLIHAIDATGEDKNAIMAGIAPVKVLRKATLQSTIDPGARRGKSEGGNVLSVELAEVKPDDKGFNISNAPPSPRVPSENDDDVAAPAAAPADSVALKAPPVLPQLPKPLFGTSVNQEEDDAVGNDAVLNMLEQDWANANYEDDDIVAPMAPLDPKQPVFSPPQPKNAETVDDMDLGENESDIEEPDSQV